MLSRLRGQAAEQRAGLYLKSQGITLLYHNFKTPRGEIDLIGQEGSTLIFFEIKYRANTRFGAPQEMLKAPQIQRIRKTALYFILQNPRFQNAPCRFDLLAFTPKSPIEWLKDAF